MSHIVSRTSIRSSVEVPFWEFTEADNAYFTTAYLGTGKSLGRTLTVSEDGFSEVRVNEWESLEAWKEFSSDPAMLPRYNERDTYNTDNAIYSYVEHSN